MATWLWSSKTICIRGPRRRVDEIMIGRNGRKSFTRARDDADRAESSATLTVAAQPLTEPRFAWFSRWFLAEACETWLRRTSRPAQLPRKRQAIGRIGVDFGTHRTRSPCV
jgi:hypothetical protein